MVQTVDLSVQVGSPLGGIRKRLGWVERSVSYQISQAVDAVAIILLDDGRCISRWMPR